MIDHSANNELLKKTACGMLGWIGIPKKYRLEVLKIMEEKKLVKEIDRYKIRIINPEKSVNIDSSINELIWGEMLK